MTMLRLHVCVLGRGVCSLSSGWGHGNGEVGRRLPLFLHPVISDFILLQIFSPVTVVNLDLLLLSLPKCRVSVTISVHHGTSLPLSPTPSSQF